MFNSLLSEVQCDENAEALFWAARREAEEVSDEDLEAAGEWFDSILPHIEDENLCAAGEKCGWIPCECS